MSETIPPPFPDTAPEALSEVVDEAPSEAVDDAVARVADVTVREPAVQAITGPGAEASDAKPVTAPMSPAECAQQLKQRFPALFGGTVKPLKLRIQVDIQERAPGVFGKQSLSAFFRRHTGGTSYLIAMTKAPSRFDLDGQPAGEITDEHRKVAADELARRRGNQEERRQLDDQQRRNRAGLLHDFQITTLTKANFCALKGVPVDDLDGLLAIARGEAEERARQAPPPRHAPGHAPRHDRPQRSEADRAPRPGEGDRPRHAEADRSRRGGRGRG